MKNALELARQYSYALPEAKDLQIVRREHLSKAPDGASSSIAPSQTISFTIPESPALLVPRETYFTMRVKTDSATDYFSGGIQRLINRVRISSLDGTVLEDVSDYNVLYEGIIRNLFMSDDYELDALAVSGVYDSYASDKVVADSIRLSDDTDFSHRYKDNSTALQSATDDSAAHLVGTIPTDYSNAGVLARMNTGNGKLFAFSLDGSGIFGADQFLPLRYMKGLRIELYLESASIAMTSGTNYTINAPKMYYTQCHPSEQVQATLNKMFQRGELALAYDTWSSRNATISSSNSVSLDINKAVLRANAVFAVKRLTSILASGYDSFKFNCNNLGTTDGTDASKIQFEWNSIKFPTDPIESRERAYIEARKAVGQWGSVQSDLCKYKDYVADKFVVACGLMALPEDDAMSGADLKGGKSVLFSMDLSSTETSRIDTFLWYKSVLMMSPNGLQILE